MFSTLSKLYLNCSSWARSSRRPRSTGVRWWWWWWWRRARSCPGRRPPGRGREARSPPESWTRRGGWSTLSPYRDPLTSSVSRSSGGLSDNFHFVNVTLHQKMKYLFIFLFYLFHVLMTFHTTCCSYLEQCALPSTTCQSQFFF